MDIAIIYDSFTGNTKLLADTIYKKINKSNIVYFGHPQIGIEADLYIVGSPTNRGMCTKPIEEFLDRLSNKKIVYFGTAGFGGSDEYYEKLFNMIRQHISANNEIIDYFYCQGKMPLSTREKYEEMLSLNPNDEKAKQFIENFDKAIQHPNDYDIKNIENWVENIMTKL